MLYEIKASLKLFSELISTTSQTRLIWFSNEYGHKTNYYQGKSAFNVNSPANKVLANGDYDA